MKPHAKKINNKIGESRGFPLIGCENTQETWMCISTMVICLFIL